MNEFLEHLFLYYRRPEEAPKQKKNACLYSHRLSHQLLQLEGSLYTNSSTTKDRQVREHPCHSHTQRMTNKKVNRAADAKRPHDSRANEIKGKKSTNRNSTSEIFELRLGACRCADHRSGRSARGRRFFVDNRSIVTKADEARLP